jgi:hypothetical protein
MKTTQIPASKAQWGTYIKLCETAQEQVRTILDEVVKHPGTPGSETHKIADLYLSFVGENARVPRYRSTDMGALWKAHATSWPLPSLSNPRSFRARCHGRRLRWVATKALFFFLQESPIP